MSANSTLNSYVISSKFVNISFANRCVFCSSEVDGSSKKKKKKKKHHESDKEHPDTA